MGLFVKQSIIALCVLFCVLQSAHAEAFDEQRELAKTAYFSGEHDIALSAFTKLSTTGDAESQYYLGLIYLTDHWSGVDATKALSYLLSSADQNNTEAMWKIGELYENGRGVNKDMLSALDWYRKSKRLEATKSKVRFLKMNNGNTTLQSNAEIIKNIETSALNNDAESQFKLANIYDEGKLAERNVEKAFHWYQLAAKNNHSYSMLLTGYMLCRGEGVEANKDNANLWLKKSDRKAHCN